MQKAASAPAIPARAVVPVSATTTLMPANGAWSVVPMARADSDTAGVSTWPLVSVGATASKAPPFTTVNVVLPSAASAAWLYSP